MNNAFLNEMHLTAFSAAAYAVAWVIYLGYLGRILLRMKRVETESNEMKKATVSNLRGQRE